MKNQCQAERLSVGRCSRRGKIHTGPYGDIALCDQHYRLYLVDKINIICNEQIDEIKRSKCKKLGMKMIQTGIRLLLRCGEIEAGGRILVTNSCNGNFNIIRAGEHARKMMASLEEKDNDRTITVHIAPKPN